MNKIKSYIIAHKIISSIIFIIILAIGYFGYKKATSTAGDTRYITAKVERGTIIASVSGTGQVSADSQIDLKPKVSGDIISLYAKNGDRVLAGALIAEIDPTDAKKAVRDAETNLESQKISLEKLKIANSEENQNADLEKVYADGFDDVSLAFLDLPSIVIGLEDILAEKNLSNNVATSVSRTAQDFRGKAETSYYIADKAFMKNRKDYDLLDANSSKSDIEKIIIETGETVKILSSAIKNTLDFVNFMNDRSDNHSQFTSTLDTLSSYTSTLSSHFSSLTIAKTSIDNNRDTFQNTDLDLRNAELTLKQKENALQDAKDKLADYFIRAPYSGTIANLTVKKSDSVSGNTLIATIITDKQLAEISMNEVDVAKIKIGEKTTLTFDAVPELTITGVVEEIDSIGTVAQGVVTYNVKITLDTQDNRVKPGMSVTAAIITDMKQNVLSVPNGAIKSQAGESYVEMFDGPLAPPSDGLIGTISKIAPNKIPVEIGLSNDTQSEIISGINEGDEIVVRTILPSGTTTPSAPSIFGSPAGRGGGNGNGIRVPVGR